MLVSGRAVGRTRRLGAGVRRTRVQGRAGATINAPERHSADILLLVRLVHLLFARTSIIRIIPVIIITCARVRVGNCETFDTCNAITIREVLRVLLRTRCRR